MRWSTARSSRTERTTAFRRCVGAAGSVNMSQPSWHMIVPSPAGGPDAYSAVSSRRTVSCLSSVRTMRLSKCDPAIEPWGYRGRSSFRLPRSPGRSPILHVVVGGVQKRVSELLRLGEEQTFESGQSPVVQRPRRSRTNRSDSAFRAEGSSGSVDAFPSACKRAVSAWTRTL